MTRRIAAGTCARGYLGPTMTTQPYLRSFVTPAALCAFGFLVAMTAVLQYSVRAFIPGSLEPGGFTLANFTTLLKPLYAEVFLNTVWICFLTAFCTLIVGYPLAYALVHVQNKIAQSTILITVVTPLFLGEVVRTYSWIIVLGNNGFINSLLLKLGVIDAPFQFMFTRFGVVIALVHVTMPVMVIMLAAALSHIDRDYQKAAEKSWRGTNPRVPDRDIAAFDARGHRRRDYGFRVDLQRLRHAAVDRRRQGQHDLEPGVSARLRELQFSVRGKPLRRRPGTHIGRLGAGAAGRAATGKAGAALTCHARRFSGC